MADEKTVQPEVEAITKWWNEQLKDEAIRLDNELYQANGQPGVDHVRKALQRRLDVLRIMFAHAPEKLIPNMQGRAQILEEILAVIERGPAEREVYENDMKRTEVREIRGSGTFTHSGTEEE